VATTKPSHHRNRWAALAGFAGLLLLLFISGIPGYVWLWFANPDATNLAGRTESTGFARMRKAREIDGVLHRIVTEHPALSRLPSAPPGYGGNATADILYFEEGDLRKVVFWHGWGDCPAGCTGGECFCFFYDISTGELTADRDHALDDLCPRHDRCR